MSPLLTPIVHPGGSEDKHDKSHWRGNNYLRVEAKSGHEQRLNWSGLPHFYNASHSDGLMKNDWVWSPTIVNTDSLPIDFSRSKEESCVSQSIMDTAIKIWYTALFCHIYIYNMDSRLQPFFSFRNATVQGGDNCIHLSSLYLPRQPFFLGT